MASPQLASRPRDIHGREKPVGKSAVVAPKIFGSQVVLDLYECETPHLDDVVWVKKVLVEAANAAGATIVETVFHKFSPWGISGVVVIAESHLAIHIWPENHYAAIDIFTCGETVAIEAATALLTLRFRSNRALVRQFKRGDDGSVANIASVKDEGASKTTRATSASHKLPL